MLSILLLIAIALFSLQFASVQTFLAKKVSAYLSQQLDADISLENVYFKPFTSLELNKFSIKDKHGNRILYTENVEANLVFTQFFNNKISVEELKLTDAFIDYQLYKDSSNFKFLIDYFTSSEKEEKPEKKKLEINLDRIEFKNNHFKFVNHQSEYKTRGINFSDIELTEFSGVLDDIKMDSSGVNFSAEKLHFKEKSGFHLKELTAQSSISNREIELDAMLLQTNYSKLSRYVRMQYHSFKDFEDFIDKVKMNSTLENSTVDSRDIEFFAPDMKLVRFRTDVISANLSGTVSNILARDVSLSMLKSTKILADFTIKGLPDINKTQFDVSIGSLQSTIEEIEKIVPELGNLKSFKLPEQIQKFGQVNYVGTFKGLYSNFVLDGFLESDLGDIRLSSNLEIGEQLKYKGTVSSESFDAGKLINLSDLSTTGLAINFDGTDLDLEKMNLTADALLTQTNFKNYSYDSIQFNGSLIEQQLELNGSIQDQNLNVTYATDIDWSAPEARYNLDADLNFANLHALNLFQKDSIILKNTSFKTDITGSNLNDLQGNFSAKNIHLQSSRGEFDIDFVDLKAEGNENSRLLSLNSDVATIEILGNIDLNTIRPYFESLAMRYAPAIGLELKPYNQQNFNLNLSIKSFKPISAFFDPSLSLEDGATLKANFSTQSYKAQFSAFSPSVTYKGISVKNLSIDENADDTALSIAVLADQIKYTDSTYINNIEISTILANDSLQFAIQLSEDSLSNQLKLNGDIHFAHNKPAYIHFKESSIKINHEFWQLNEDSELRVSKGKFYLNNLVLSHLDQQVKINGVLSNDDDQLSIDFNRFGLSALNGLTNPLGIHLQGEMNGNLTINSVFKNPFFSSNLQTSTIIYNQIPVGKLNLVADFEPQTNIATLKLDLLDDLQRGLNVSGTYNLNAKQDAINLKAKLKEIDLVLFQPFLKALVSEIQGKANADLTIRGNYNNPRFSGSASIPNASFIINYLRTRYSIENQNTLLDNNSILLTNLKIRDINRSEAQANGIVNLQKLSDPYIDVNLQANNFQIMNTSFKDNNLYYGTAFATGQFAFVGPTSAINIDIDAKSNEHTVLNIPFNSAMTIADNDFIYFINPNESRRKLNEKKFAFRGLTMNMDLELTPEAEVNLATNLGSLKGNGTGEISLKISSLGDFEMFGDYSINSGKFHFTAQDFINKYFDIKQGGTIRWAGNPSEAVINMIAMYQQRTSISPLYNAAGRTGNDQRVLAQADMIIKGTISQPDVTFGLNFPQDPYIVDELQGFLSDANNVNQQALSLILRRSFTPSSTSEIGREVNNTLLSAGTEIAFNQLNSIISQSLNMNFFDLNIRSLNDASASFRFFNDRLIFTGGITDRSNLQLNDLSIFSDRVATDAELTYNIRRDGSLRFRAYNRLNTRNFLNPYDDYISAVGLVYRQEFNTFGEFWRKLWLWNSKEKENKTN
ncbi:translocation/assembly module TamB domain-containing protein [Sphingobacterium hungaricum]|uniref:translocation/assembly module TamB domain-containing protein n=1 Tax=Sphingobacterium hungaricum TaxID=2082723 RepID=UPI0018C917DD|nr:translocation/assembly module TamB domain-containing protein [Sphingobacterium hungaricum]